MSRCHYCNQPATGTKTSPDGGADLPACSKHADPSELCLLLQHAIAMHEDYERQIARVLAGVEDPEALLTVGSLAQRGDETHKRLQRLAAQLGCAQ